MLRAESKARRVASDFEMLVQAKGLAKRPVRWSASTGACSPFCTSTVATAAWTSGGTRGCVTMRSVQTCHIDHPLLPRHPRTTVHHTEPRTLLIPQIAHPLPRLPMHNTLLRTPLLHPPAPDSRGPAFHRARKDPSRQRQPGSCPLRGAPNHFVCSPSAENMAKMVPPLDFT